MREEGTDPVISNYKCSIRVKDPRLLDKIMKLGTDDPDTYRVSRVNNFMVLRAKGWVFIIFANGFVNITKIRSLRDERLPLMNFLTSIFVVDGGLTIDNITATAHLEYRGFAKLIRAAPKVDTFFKYNAQSEAKRKLGLSWDFTTFPAIKIFTDVGTGLLFASGKLVIVGSKTEEHVRWVVSIVRILLRDAS